MNKLITKQTTVQEVIELMSFCKEARLIFPVDRPIKKEMTLKQISSPDIYLWYSHIYVEKTIEVIEALYQNSKKYPIFYHIYSKEERLKDPSKNNTGLFFFKGKKNAPFALCNAGGGFVYVGALHDSFPHALYLSKKGYNAFVLIYRINHPYDDLAKAISFIYHHRQSLEVDSNHYSLWGGSAGARMAATLGNKQILNSYFDGHIPQADAIIMQYTGYNRVSKDDGPTYACVGTNDWIADYNVMQTRLKRLSKLNIATEFHCYPGLEHGFGLGLNTISEGWIDDAINFWQRQIKQ